MFVIFDEIAFLDTELNEVISEAHLWLVRVP